MTYVDPMVHALRELVAFASVMTWSGWSPPFVGTASGSELVAALESAYDAVKREFLELPDVVMITGSGLSGRGLTWGHFGRDRWRDALASGRRPEMFIGGERLATGAVLTMQTLLHECAHALAMVRDVQDTSRQHRYHNREFVKIAEQLGLEYPGDEPDSSIGWSAVVLSAQGRRRWSAEIAQLHAAITLTMDDPMSWLRKLLGPLGGPGGGAGVGGGHGVSVRGGGKGTGGSSNLKVSCPECGRIGRFSRSSLAMGPVFCGAQAHEGETYEML